MQLDFDTPIESVSIPEGVTSACIFVAVARLAVCEADPRASAFVNVTQTVALVDLLVASGIYTSKVSMGNTNSVTLSNLVAGTTYYFVVTCYNTAGDESPLEAALPAEIRQRWTYDPAACRAYVAKDRSSIYGGFHLYQLTGA